MIKKSLFDISWKVDEDTYRSNEALSYSTLSRFEKLGFNGLKHLFDKVETVSLTFGSAVDSIITGGRAEFHDRFMVSDYPEVSPSIKQIADILFERYKDVYTSLEDIPDNDIIEVTENVKYYPNWRPVTRAKVIREQGSNYYKLLYLAKDKTIIDTNTYKSVLDTVDALKTSEATRYYFQEDNPFEDIERLYQLKFKATFDNVKYRCMADLIIIDHKNKTIQPIDLKTSSKPEWDFYKSFIEWNYQIQARLYWRIISDNVKKDEYFKDFKVCPYKFIVVNKDTLHPLVWEFSKTTYYGSLYFGKNEQIELIDPFILGKELTYYLETNAEVPLKILNENNLEEYLNTL